MNNLLLKWVVRGLLFVILGCASRFVFSRVLEAVQMEAYAAGRQSVWDEIHNMRDVPESPDSLQIDRRVYDPKNYPVREK